MSEVNKTYNKFLEFYPGDIVRYLQERGDSGPNELPGGDWHILQFPRGWWVSVQRTSPDFVWPYIVYDHTDENNVPSVMQKRFTLDSETPLVMAIEANHRSAIVRFSQELDNLYTGNRYLCKVTVTEDIKFVADHVPAEDEVPLVWYRFFVVADGREETHFDWQQVESNVIQVEHYPTLLQVNEDTYIEFGLDVWIPYGNIDGDVFIHKIELIELPLDWGDKVDMVIGSLHGTPDPTPSMNIFIWILSRFNGFLQWLTRLLT